MLENFAPWVLPEPTNLPRPAHPKFVHMAIFHTFSLTRIMVHHQCGVTMNGWCKTNRPRWSTDAWLSKPIDIENCDLNVNCCSLVTVVSTWTNQFTTFLVLFNLIMVKINSVWMLSRHVINSLYFKTLNSIVYQETKWLNFGLGEIIFARTNLFLSIWCFSLFFLLRTLIR